MTQESEPEMCDGWSATIELDGEAFLGPAEGVHLPGFDGYCPECGDSAFRVEGEVLMFHVR